MNVSNRKCVRTLARRSLRASRTRNLIAVLALSGRTTQIRCAQPQKAPSPMALMVTGVPSSAVTVP